jgi:hypothetical protein
VYKCINEILANRLVPCFDGFINLNQTAFVPNPSISENVFLAQEILRDYHKKEGKPLCTLKIDLIKAYDFVNWEFVLGFLLSSAIG